MSYLNFYKDTVKSNEKYMEYIKRHQLEAAWQIKETQEQSIYVKTKTTSYKYYRNKLAKTFPAKLFVIFPNGGLDMWSHKAMRLPV